MAHDGTAMVNLIPGKKQHYLYKYGARFMEKTEIVVYHNKVLFRNSDTGNDTMECMFKLPDGVPRTAANIVEHMLKTEQMIKFTSDETLRKAGFWVSRVRLLEYSLPLLPYWVNTEQMLSISIAGNLIDQKPLDIQSFMEDMDALKYIELQDPFTFYEATREVPTRYNYLKNVDIHLKCNRVPDLLKLKDFINADYELTLNISDLCDFTDKDFVGLVPFTEVWGLKFKIDFRKDDKDKAWFYDLKFVEKLFNFIKFFPDLTDFQVCFKIKPLKPETCLKDAVNLHNWIKQVNFPCKKVRFKVYLKESAEISEFDILKFRQLGYVIGKYRHLPPDTLTIDVTHENKTLMHTLIFSDRKRQVDVNRGDTPSPTPMLNANAETIDAADPVPAEVLTEYYEFITELNAARRVLKEQAANKNQPPNGESSSAHYQAEKRKTESQSEAGPSKKTKTDKNES